MHKATFQNGGFVPHKVYLPDSVCKFSAWYDKHGELLDAERIDRLSRSCMPSDRQMSHLKIIGRVWR